MSNDDECSIGRRVALEALLNRDADPMAGPGRVDELRDQCRDALEELKALTDMANQELRRMRGDGDGV